MAMKRIGYWVLDWFEAMGRARAASALSRMGRHEEAKALMLSE
jgi:hypothetical protein